MTSLELDCCQMSFTTWSAIFSFHAPSGRFPRVVVILVRVCMHEGRHRFAKQKQKGGHVCRTFVTCCLAIFPQLMVACTSVMAMHLCVSQSSYQACDAPAFPVLQLPSLLPCLGGLGGRASRAGSRAGSRAAGLMALRTGLRLVRVAVARAVEYSLAQSPPPPHPTRRPSRRPLVN